MATRGFANLAPPVQGTGAQVGSLRLGKHQAGVQAYQAERAADRADRVLELEEQAARDKRAALARWLKQEMAKMRALAKIAGPDGGGGGGGVSPSALGPAPPPPNLVAPQATPMQYPGHMQGPGGSIGIFTPPTSPDSFGGVTAGGPGQLPAVPPGAGADDPRQWLMDDGMRVVGTPQGDMDTSRFSDWTQQRPETSELFPELRSEGLHDLPGPKAYAGPYALMNEDTDRKAFEEAMMRRESGERIPGDTGPVPGAGVPSRPDGFAPSTRPAGYPSLSPGEAASTRRAGGLVFHGAPRATDYQMPQPRPTAPAPQAMSTRGAEARVRRLRTQVARALASGNTEAANALKTQLSALERDIENAKEQERYDATQRRHEEEATTAQTRYETAQSQYKERVATEDARHKAVIARQQAKDAAEQAEANREAAEKEQEKRTAANAATAAASLTDTGTVGDLMREWHKLPKDMRAHEIVRTAKTEHLATLRALKGEKGDPEQLIDSGSIPTLARQLAESAAGGAGITPEDVAKMAAKLHNLNRGYIKDREVQAKIAAGESPFATATELREWMQGAFGGLTVAFGDSVVDRLYPFVALPAIAKEHGTTVDKLRAVIEKARAGDTKAQAVLKKYKVRY